MVNKFGFNSSILLLKFFKHDEQQMDLRNIIVDFNIHIIQTRFFKKNYFIIVEADH